VIVKDLGSELVLRIGMIEGTLRRVIMGIEILGEMIIEEVVTMIKEIGEVMGERGVEREVGMGRGAAEEVVKGIES
jgi:aspartate aminotransferase-like enzyme